MFIDTPLSPFLKRSTSQKVDICYLDNTYCSKHYDLIPTREKAKQEIFDYIEANLKEDKKFVLKYKKLGKETLLIELAKKFKCKILMSKERFLRFTKVLELDEKYFTYTYDQSLFIEVEDLDKNFSSVMAKRFNLDKVCYIEPTAMALNKHSHVSTRSLRSNNKTCVVPYTDHSSYTELIEFIKLLQPKSVQPIVKEIEANTFNTYVINDMSCFDKYLCKEPLVESLDQYRLLLQTTSLIRSNRRLNQNVAKKRVKYEIHNKRVLKKKRALPRIIAYESLSPVKSKVTTESGNWVQLSANVEILTEEEPVLLKSPINSPTAMEEDVKSEIEINEVSCHFDNLSFLQVEFKNEPIEIAETQPFQISTKRNTQTDTLQSPKFCSTQRTRTVSTNDDCRSIVISHTLDDYFENENEIAKNNRSKLCEDSLESSAESFESARSNSIDNLKLNKEDDLQSQAAINFIKNCCIGNESIKDDDEFDQFITKLMSL